jgi:hypothetical protein
MSDAAMVPHGLGDRGSVSPSVVDQELADRLLAKAQAGIQLLGPDGLLSQVTKAVLERALTEEPRPNDVLARHAREFVHDLPISFGSTTAV